MRDAHSAHDRDGITPQRARLGEQVTYALGGASGGTRGTGARSWACVVSGDDNGIGSAGRSMVHGGNVQAGARSSRRIRS